MAHLMTILVFLAMGGIALGTIMATVAEYADRIGHALGIDRQQAMAGSRTRRRARRMTAMRSGPPNRRPRMRAAA